MSSGLKVIAPASVSNLACGFDTLGMAIDIPSDEIIGKWSETPGIRIVEISGHKKDIPLAPEKNTAGIAARSLLKYLGEDDRGLDLKIHKHIPPCSGLGSSASSATAVTVLINELLNRPLEKKELIHFALDGEVIASGSRHGDNVIPALLGGLMLIRDIETIDYHRIYTPAGLYMAILLPDVMIPTKTAREILRKEVPLQEMVRQSANLGSFIIGMHLGDLDLIGRSMRDQIIEPQRKHLIPYFEDVQHVALELGALSCSLSGAGPAIFALCQEKMKASEILTAMEAVYMNHGLDARTFIGKINHEGTVAV